MKNQYDQTDFIAKGLEEYESLIIIVNESITFLMMLLSSKTQQDTVEAIKVF